MSHAEKCPVCRGSGKVTNPDSWKEGGTAIVRPTITCHGCAGSGWVLEEIR